MGSARDWVDYWSRADYDADFWRRSLADYVERLRRHVHVGADARVLDFGCGPGFLAPALAPHVAELWLADPSAALCEHARALTAELPGVRVVELTDSSALDALPRGAFELVVVNSVLQYVPSEETPALLARLGERLAPGGRLVVSDLVPRRASLLPELGEVFSAYRRWFGVGRFARFLVHELGQLRARPQLPLTRHEPRAFEALVSREYRVTWIPNPTVCRSRLAAVLTPHAGAS